MSKKTRRKRQREWEVDYTHKLRLQIINKLGSKCANPFNLNHGDFVKKIECLQIDHVHGGGREVRGLRLYYKYILRKLKKGSKDYQLLCANCNWLKRIVNKEDQRRKISIESI